MSITALLADTLPPADVTPEHADRLVALARSAVQDRDLPVGADALAARAAELCEQPVRA